MIILFAAAILLSQEPAPRAWLASDPLVQFDGNSHVRPLMPSNDREALYQVVVACNVQPDYSLTACRSLRVTPSDDGLEREGPAAVRHIRLRETPDGPRAGDNLVFDIRVQTDRRASGQR